MLSINPYPGIGVTDICDVVTISCLGIISGWIGIDVIANPFSVLASRWPAGENHHAEIWQLLDTSILIPWIMLFARQADFGPAGILQKVCKIELFCRWNYLIDLSCISYGSSYF